MKKYVVELSVDERESLELLTKRGKAAAYKIKHAHILLKADEGEHGPGWTDARIAEAFDCGTATVERMRQRLVEQGLEAALGRVKRGPQPRKLDGQAEAVLIATACSEPPAGHQRWSLRLLADRLVELGVVDSCSRMTVQRTLKKMN